MRCALLLLVAAELLCARQLPIRIYTTADGLPSSDIHRIVRDSRGYLWFCTDNGLSRFDGYRFVNYGTEDGLPNDTIFDILEEPGGRWWVATQRGLVEFRPAGPPRFTVYGIAGKANRSVRKLMLDRTGRLWVGTFDGLFRSEGGSFARIPLGEPDEYGGTIVTSMVEDRYGAMWVGLRSGLYRRWPDGRVERYTPKNRYPYWNIEAILEDRSGRLWVGMRGALCLLRNNPKGRAAVERVYTAADGLPGNAVWAMLQSSDGRLWAAAQEGFAQILVEPERSTVSFEAIGSRSGLRNTVCIALAEDLSGNLWIGTEGGAARLARTGFSAYTEADGLAGVQIASIFESRAGKLLVATRRANQTILNERNGDRFTPVHAPLRGGTWTFGQTALQSRTGEWWFATSKGLLRFPPIARASQLTRTAPIGFYQTPHGLAGDSITVLYEDSRGDIWFQSMGKAQVGWHRLEPAMESMRSYSAAEMGIEPSDLQALAEDRDGNLWLGFRGSLVRYRDGEFRAFTSIDTVPAGGAYALHGDQAGRLWAGSSEHGLLRIDQPSAERLQVISYARPQGLSSNSVSAITEDRWGRIYAATGRGIDRLDPDTGRIEHFSSADGLPSEFADQAFRDRTGILWFATGEGLVRFDPELPAPEKHPPILISAIRIRGVSQPISDLGQTVVALPDLPSAQNQIQIDFTSLNFDPGAVVSYQYRLVPADSDWSSPTTLRTVNYASLKAGRYRFLVRAESSGASVDFTVLPPLWARWWFRLPLAAFLGLVGYGLHRYRVQYLLAVERVRARIAADLHDDVGASLSQIAILSEVARSRLNSAAPQAAGPLAEIAAISGEVMDSISDMVWAINPKHDRLSDLVSRVRRFAGDMLGAREIAMDFRSPEGEDPWLGAEARRQFLLIAKEAVNNIARHSGATQATIEFCLDDHRLTLRVRDNGRGFHGASPQQGNGLANIRRRASMLGGSADLQASPGAGSSIAVTAPIRN